jgi:muramoyltetrapeptide carboxypeptidase
MSDLDAGLRRLQVLGFEIVTGFEMSDPPGYLSDPDEVRLRYLNGMLAREDIRAIFCVRGGYGSLRLLDRIDYDAVRRSPKIVVGYSDITALHLAILTRTGVPGLSAAMVATDWKNIDASEADTVFALLKGESRDGLYGDEGLLLDAGKPGYARGRAVGGNLSVICRLIGTPYFPDPADAILFLEEVGEQPYRVDGLLAQLRLSGVLERIGGLVIGGITEADPAEGRPSLTVSEVLSHYSGFVGGPVATGLRYGHFQPKIPMPVGVQVELEVDDRSARLRALEPLVTTA